MEIDGAGEASDIGLQIGVKRESNQFVQSNAQLLVHVLSLQSLGPALAYIEELKLTDAININVGKKP
jgi:hypothetical protein